MIKFSDKKIKCGYLGETKLQSIKIGDQLVCSSGVESIFSQPPDGAPQLPHADKFIVLVKSYVLVDYTPQQVLESVTSNSWSTWSVKHHISGSDADGLYHWYKIACTSPVAVFKMKSVSAYKVIIVDRSWTNEFTYKSTSFERCFIGMNKLVSCEFKPGMGPISNFHDIFARNASVEYVKFLPSHFGVSKNFHGIFHECYNLKYVTCMNTSKMGMSSGGFDRTYMFTSCDKLVRPEYWEKKHLINHWGFNFQYDFDSPRSRISDWKYYRIYVTSSKNFEATGLDSWTTISSVTYSNENGADLVHGSNALASSTYTTYEASNIWGGSSSFWHAHGGNLPQWVSWEVIGQAQLSSLRFAARDSDDNLGRTPTKFLFQGSNDRQNWTDLINVTDNRAWEKAEIRNYLIGGTYATQTH